MLAKFLARRAVVAWLIRRAERTPYTHLVDPDGSVYMRRYWLFNPYEPHSDGRGRRWGDWLPSIRLHHIMREDRDAHLHDHPWNARTFILRGWYHEIRYEPHADRYHIRQAGTTATLQHGRYHRIAQVSPGGVWTLFITYRYRGTWGFLVNGRKVAWREYLKGWK
jgi:hypothetical protein